MKLCPNENHGQAAVAIATITWPDGRYNPTDGCSGCVRQMFDDAINEGWPVAIEPIPEAYGVCPRCDRSVRRRPSGLIGAHIAHWRPCDGVGQEAAEAVNATTEVTQ